MLWRQPSEVDGGRAREIRNSGINAETVGRLPQEYVKHPQDQERHWLIVCLTSASSPRFNPAGPSLSELCQHTGMRMETLEVRLKKFGSIPGRKGTRPSTIRGPLHIQCDGSGPKYLRRLISEVFTWPQIDATPSIESSPDLISIRLTPPQSANSSLTTVAVKAFARVYLEASTICLTLPLVTAHWAILGGWAEPHYLASHGLMAAGTVLLYSPRDASELEVCRFHFSRAYEYAGESFKRKLGATMRSAPSAAVLAFEEGKPSSPK